MTLKRRLEAIEQKAGGMEPTIAFFRTLFEDRNGEVEGESYSASIADGPAKGTFLEREGSETFEEFEGRVRTAARGDRSVGYRTAQDANRGSLSPTINMHVEADASREGQDSS